MFVIFPISGTAGLLKQSWWIREFRPSIHMKICQTCSRSASVLNWVTLLVRLVKRKVLVLNLQKIRNGSKKWMGDTKALRSALNSGLDSDLRGLVGLPRWFMMCSWTRRVTLTLPLPNQEYKWVPRNCRKSLTRCWEEGRRGFVV